MADRPALPTEDISPLEARHRLGRVLYEEMERAEPSLDPVEWDDLSDDDRHYYIDLIAYLFDRTDLVKALLADPHLLAHSTEVPRDTRTGE